MGLYPNVCYHKEKRKVLTTESRAALVHKSSVNCTNKDIKFPSPFFVFGEKVGTCNILRTWLKCSSPEFLMFLLREKELVKNINLSKFQCMQWNLYVSDSHQSRFMQTNVYGHPTSAINVCCQECYIRRKQHCLR